MAMKQENNGPTVPPMVIPVLWSPVVWLPGIPKNQKNTSYFGVPWFESQTANSDQNFDH